MLCAGNWSSQIFAHVCLLYKFYNTALPSPINIARKPSQFNINIKKFCCREVLTK